MRDVTELPPVAPNRSISYGADPNQYIDIFESSTARSRATLMMIHGGFWRAKYASGHASFLCAALAREGMNVANVEYRRVGNQGGGWPGTFNDIQAAADSLSALFPHSPLIVCGHSAGGHLALRLGCGERRLTGVIGLAPAAVLQDVYDLHLSNDAVVEFMGGTPNERPEAYEQACPSKHRLTVPAILMHGTDDEVVPISISRSFIEARSADAVRLIELPSTGHMELIDPETQAFRTVTSSIVDLLR
jgi:acetyl esterase/lipase